LVIDRLQAEQWEASRLPDALPRYRETPCQENCLEVRLLVADGPTPLRVPVATGHRLDASSVRLNGDSVAVFETEHGEAILRPRDRRQGLLEYRSGPAPAWPAGTDPSRRATLDPGTASPALREVAAAIRPLPIAAGVQQALDFVARTITYDRTPATLRAYGRAVRERSDFVTAALDVGAGDCDVQNGVLLTLLRLRGIEARLVLGYVGLGGTVATGLHAWVEYLDADGRWSVADASITGDPEIHHPLAHPPESSADPSVGVSIPHRVAASLDAPGQQARTFGLAALLILGLGTTAWLARRRVGPQVELGPDENLAALLGGALRHPEAFAGLPAMFHGRFVPLLETASAISLDRARRLGAQNRLFRSGKGSDLARKAAARGIPVIDAAAPEGRVTSVALGAIDLDRWSGLLQQSLETRLCSRINERLEALHAPWRVREVSGLPEPWTEVALEDLRLGRRLMLLDMDQLEFAPARRLLPQQLDAAAFTTLDVLLHRLDMSDRERAKILAAFAESAVSEAVHSEAVQPEAVSSGAVQSEAVETETVPPGDLP
ncbi:MAG: transglutaminase-like domain-containing protein, partial [Acidobacteriota bacterium]